jgi:hypothetical protein
MRVGWEIEETHLEVTVRDDDALFPEGMAEYRLRETLTELGGDFAVDAVPGWGTTVVARFPLTLAQAPAPGALRDLSHRDLDVSPWSLEDEATGRSQNGSTSPSTR